MLIKDKSPRDIIKLRWGKIEEMNDIEMRVKEALKLNTYELKAYFTLIRLGRLRPPEIAKQAKIPIQRIYDTLKSLQAKGLVVADEDSFYEVVEPRVSFSSIANTFIIKAREKAKEIEALGNLVSSLSARSTKEEIKVIYGINESLGHAISLVKQCDEKVYFMVYKVVDRLDELWPILYHLIESIRKGGIIIVPTTFHVSETYVNQVEKNGLQIIKSSASFMDMMVCCSSTIIGLPSSSYGVISVLINNKDFAEALKNRFMEFSRNIKDA